MTSYKPYLYEATKAYLAEIFDTEFKEFESVIRDEYKAQGIKENKRKINLLLLGITGSGKSALGNAAVGEKKFKSSSGFSSVTKEVEHAEVEFDTFTVNVIDTPGLSDTIYGSDGDQEAKELEKVRDNMEKIFEKCPTGIHAFLFVLRLDVRFTSTESKNLDYLKRIFGHSFLKERGIIIFTHGDTFEENMKHEGTPEKSFEEWCRKQTGPLSDLMKECPYRYHIVNNRIKDVKEKQMQMESVFEKVLSFRDSYKLLDFYVYKNVRSTLIVELKAPKIRNEVMGKIHSLMLEINLLCTSKNAQEEDFKSLDKQLAKLEEEIHKVDEKTGVLDDLTKKISDTHEYLRTKLEAHNNKCVIL